LTPVVERAAQTIPGVEYLGRQPKEGVLALMKEARLLMFPSLWYEGLSMSILEAYAVGLPVVASNVGTMSTLVKPGRTGLHFRVGDVGDSIEKVEWAIAHPEQIDAMRQEARSQFERHYTAERNYQQLIEIYQLAGVSSV
jgi:glycosyltransferase involved in cell wall biosynthesis